MKHVSNIYLPWEAGQRRLRRWVLGLRWVRLVASIPLIMLVYLGIASSIQRHRVKETQDRIDQLRLWVREFRVVTGRCPANLQELSKVSRHGVLPSVNSLADPFVDAWGRRFWFQCPAERYSWDVEIVSAGPSGNWVSTDLIR